MFDFLKSLNTVTVDLAEVIVAVLEVQNFRSLEDLRSNVVAITIKHDFAEKFTFLRRIFHEYYAQSLKLILRHGFDGFLYDT